MVRGALVWVDQLRAGQRTGQGLRCGARTLGPLPPGGEEHGEARASQKVTERSGKVAAEDIRLGYELTKGKLVTVDQDQLEELKPRSTRTNDISDFVQLSEIDPVFYDRTYWLAPARRPYALLVHAMDDRRQVGIGAVVMRNKHYLAAIRCSATKRWPCRPCALPTRWCPSLTWGCPGRPVPYRRLRNCAWPCR